MDKFRVKVFVPGGAGTVEESFKAGSDYNARRLIEARYGRQARVVQVTQEHTPSRTSSGGTDR